MIAYGLSAKDPKIPRYYELMEKAEVKEQKPERTADEVIATISEKLRKLGKK